MTLTSPSSSVRHLGAAAFALLVLGGLAGTALADPAARTHDYSAQLAKATRPDDRAGIRGVGSPLLASATHATAAVRPDDRAGVHGIGTTDVTAAVRPDDRGGVRGIGTTEVAAAAATAAGSSRFHWGDAGIGASGMLGIVLLAGALVLLRSHFRAPASHA